MDILSLLWDLYYMKMAKKMIKTKKELQKENKELRRICTKLFKIAESHSNEIKRLRLGIELYIKRS